MRIIKKIKPITIALIVLAFVFALALTFIVGTDTAFGKVEISELNLVTADGDELHTMLYKPKTATADSLAPCAMITHGGSDMLEQVGTYALELARRGYVVVTWDYSGSHDSDLPTGNSEGANGISKYPSMGLNTIWNTVNTFNFVDFEHIVTMGHSMGGQYTVGWAIEHQEEIFLQLNLGMNQYGPIDVKEHNFNFVNVLGDSDESSLARSNNDNYSLLQIEQLKRMYLNDYETEASALEELTVGKVYSVVGTDGETYTRTSYMPNSCHAYYLVNQEAVQTVLYAITSQVGVGLDSGVSSYGDVSKISTVWQLKDIGFVLLLLSIVGTMFIVAVSLFKTKAFEGLKLAQTQAVGFKKYSWQWFVALAVMVILPPLLYSFGSLQSVKFFGIDVSKLWLVGGTPNAYISWQWVLALAFIALFVIFHFIWGRKHNGNAKNYGLSTSDTKTFSGTYILKALVYGVVVVGSGYLVMALASSLTQQGLHVATFMMSLINPNRSLAYLMYFIYLIPYFLCSSLASKSLNINGDGTTKTTVKNVAVYTAIAIGGLLILWLVFLTVLNTQNYVLPMFATNRLYINAIAILPLCIGLTVGNALNVFVSQKTNNIWVGLFTALLWGSWTIVSTGGMNAYLF